jgi:hemoglobin
MEQIKLLVDTFYEKVNQDDLLASVFNDEAAVGWAEHLPKMYAFWATQLIGSGNYYGRPFLPHSELNIEAAHFDRWLQLFIRTVDENFIGEVANLAKTKATNIAYIFQLKLGLIKCES